MVGSITRDSVKRALMNGITADQVGCFQYPHEGTCADNDLFIPNLDYQLLDHARASSDEEECEHFRRPPSCSPPVGSHVVLFWSLNDLPAAASSSETIDPGDRAGSNKAVGAGKEQGQVR